MSRGRRSAVGRTGPARDTMPSMTGSPRWLAAWLAPLALGCGSDSDDGVTSGPSCDEVCEAAASCGEPPASPGECWARCDAQRAHFNKSAWAAYSGCVTAGACESLDACTQEAIAASSAAASDAFLREICDWAVDCVGGVWTQSECVQMLSGLGADEDAGAGDASSPWDFVRLLKSSSVSCVSGCIRGLSCAEADFGAAGMDCAQRCGLAELGNFGSSQPPVDESCEAQHGSCGDHGQIQQNEFGGCECLCDDTYLSSNWVCVPDCEQTGCGGHGTCDPSGTCNCEPDYYATPGAVSGGCTARPYYVDLATAEHASCAVRDGGQVECWGDSLDAVVEELPDPNEGFVSVVMGSSPIDSSACALRADGEAVCWGAIAQPDARLAPGFLALGVYDDTGCGVVLDGSLYCWGFSPYAVTTPPDAAEYADVAIGDRIACGIRRDGSLQCWGDAAIVNEIPEIPNAVQVCGGSGGACVRRADGSIECFGFGSYVGMDVPAPNQGFVDVSCSGYHACALRADGTPACWGLDALVELVPPSDRATGYADLEVVDRHSCGLRDDGSIACWGSDTYNQAPAMRTASTSWP